MNGTVDPERYWTKPGMFGETGVGKKITAAVGMLISGIGAGVSRTPNLAIQTINAAIDRDIDAQKFNINKAGNVFKMYGEQTNSLIGQYNLTKADMLDLAAGQIAVNTAKYAGPIAQQNAAIAIQQLRRQAVDLRKQDALRNLQIDSGTLDLQMKMASQLAIKHILEGNGSDMDRAFLPKEMAEKYVEVRGPNGEVVGHGFADGPKQKEEYDKSAIATQELQANVDQLAKLLQENPYGGRPYSDARTAINNIKLDVVTKLNQLAGLQRLTHDEVQIFERRLDNIGSLAAERAKTELDLLQNDINSKIAANNQQLLHQSAARNTFSVGRRAGQ
jgi:hypothetical protein